ncbi:gamma-glutamyl-gamma-aminobutyrate hydrolase family protein [Streptomyces sp. NPDC004134]|uniref:gamma-glutamyl-gamma-aminobutyrate hydrolase family protein n=1 Tax=Streptomyces sp. NPDC004134 TaxID=3364691 RepID=UPI003676202D
MTTASERPDGAGRPVIGITAATSDIKVAVFDMRATFTPQQFVDRVARAGGTPVVLPPLPEAASAVAGLDGLLLLAGPDVEPARYGAERHPETKSVDPVRDEAELAVIAEALRLDVPFLGICRALQLLNVLRGGTLHQHLPDLIGHTGHSPGLRDYGDQRVSLEGGSRIAKVFGSDAATVPCHHHQVVDVLGKGLRATAWSVADGIVEAVEVPDHPFGVTVQWHAEESDDDRPFLALVEAARHHRGTRGARGSDGAGAAG